MRLYSGWNCCWSLHLHFIRFLLSFLCLCCRVPIWRQKSYVVFRSWHEYILSAFQNYGTKTQHSKIHMPISVQCWDQVHFVLTTAIRILDSIVSLCLTPVAVNIPERQINREMAANYPEFFCSRRCIQLFFDFSKSKLSLNCSSCRC